MYVSVWQGIPTLSSLGCSLGQRTFSVLLRVLFEAITCTVHYAHTHIPLRTYVRMYSRGVGITTARVGKTTDISASVRKIPPCVFTSLPIQYIPTTHVYFPTRKLGSTSMQALYTHQGAYVHVPRPYPHGCLPTSTASSPNSRFCHLKQCLMHALQRFDVSLFHGCPVLQIVHQLLAGSGTCPVVV